MGLASEMKNLSEEILASFKQRIKDNEELVNDVQNTLDGFRNDQMEMARVINVNAKNLRKGLANGEKERLHTYNDLMTVIHSTISSIQKEVVEIQSETSNLIHEFTAERAEMADGLDTFFKEGRTARLADEKERMKEFDLLMKHINADVAAIFKSTSDLLEKFEKEHQEMSAELRAELGKNLEDRVEYTRSLLAGFQKRLAEIGKQNQKTAQKLRKDLANGETERLSEYNGLMKDIHTAIKGISKEVKDIQKVTAKMMGDYTQDRGQGSAEWNKMQDAIAAMRKTGLVMPGKPSANKPEKKEIKKEAAEVAAIEIPIKKEPEAVIVTEDSFSLEQKVLEFIMKHPNGVKVSEMEVPFNETRMKLGFIAKALLDAGKVQKVDNVYFPLK